MYVINLKRRPDRLQTFYEKLDFPKDNINIVYGFDGKNYENERQEEKNMYYKMSNMLMSGEKGCLISHIRIYKEIVDKNIPFAMIFEDDCVLCDDFKNKIEKIINEMPEDTQILYFGGRDEEYFKMEEGTYSRITENIVAHKNVTWNKRNFYNHDRTTHGYIISQKLAFKFISFFENNYKLNIAIDQLIIMECMNNNISIYNSYPLLCYSQVNSKDSDIRGHLL